MRPAVTANDEDNRTVAEFCCGEVGFVTVVLDLEHHLGIVHNQNVVVLELRCGDVLDREVEVGALRGRVVGVCNEATDNHTANHARARGVLRHGGDTVGVCAACGGQNDITNVVLVRIARGDEIHVGGAVPASAVQVTRRDEPARTFRVGHDGSSKQRFGGFPP